MRKSVPISIGFCVAIASVPTLSLFATLVILHNSRISQLKAIGNSDNIPHYKWLCIHFI